MEFDLKDTLRLISYSLIIWISLSGMLFSMPNPDRFEFIFMDELESGMRGEALTVIEGAKIESFTVDLIGIQVSTIAIYCFAVCQAM